MEWLLAGEKLQRCRIAFVPDLPEPGRVLMCGEGNGRCLIELLRSFPKAHFTCVDSSRRMLECAEERVRAHGLAAGNVEFIHADVLTWSAPSARFDLLVTDFFLDCFRADQLAEIVSRLASSTAPGARWLLADFREPASGYARWRARGILRVMYFFFQRATGLPAARLTPPDECLGRNGFVLRERRVFEWGLLHSDLWQSV